MRILLPLLLLFSITGAMLYFINTEQTQTNADGDMLQLGNFAFQEKRYEDAFQWYQKSAIQGVAQGQYHLAQMYERGQGVDKDDALALHWMKRAAEQGFVRAEFAYATMLEFGRGLEQPDLQASTKWYQRAAEHKHPEAMLKLAKLYAEGSRIPQSNYLALELALQAEAFPNTKANATVVRQHIVNNILQRAKQGDKVDQYEAAIMYQYGRGVEQNAEKAKAWLTKSARQGYAKAQYALGVSLAKNNKKEALYWLISAAKQGHSQSGYAAASLQTQLNDKRSSQEALRWFYHGLRHNDPKISYNLAIALHRQLLGLPKAEDKYKHLLKYAATQNITPAQTDFAVYLILNDKNSKQSMKWLIQAGKKGDNKAQFNLGLLYARGEGMSPNDEKALHWWKLAEQAGNTQAQMLLGLFYNLGRGTGRSENDAIFWYEKAAKSGNLNAIYNLAVLYYNGFGVERDFKKSAQYLKQLAKLGDAQAQNFYASLFLDGKGVNFSPKTAFKWFKQAAQAGDVHAMFNLATQYRSGTGIVQDDKKALYWYQKAANLGFAPAQNAVGYMYAEGRGVKKDHDMAEEWLLKASENGLDLARRNLSSLKQNSAFSLVTLQINNAIRADILTRKRVDLSQWLATHHQPIL